MTAGGVVRALLLACAPLGLALQYFSPARHNEIFFASVLSIIPLAGLIGNATEQLAAKLGGGIGGLLNATFGNAAELIIGTLGLREGLPDLVKASITGSIIGNLLLVFGAAAVAGGLHRNVQRFNRTASGNGATMLLLSAIGLTVPAVFHYLTRGVPNAPDLTLDTEIAAVLMLTYLLSLIFIFRTHRQLYGARDEHEEAAAADGGSIRRPVLVLLAATAATAVMSELLVSTVAETARGLGMSQLFIGVIVVALVGNAAEHYSAVTLAMRDRMDASIGIAVGSSTQIALFVAPLLVFISYVVGPAPMDLLFTTFELVALGISVFAIAFIAHDGETHWMEGVQLLAIYAILSLGFYFLPAR